MITKQEAETIAAAALQSVDPTSQIQLKGLFRAFERYRKATAAFLIKSTPPGPRSQLTIERDKAAKHFSNLLARFNAKHGSNISLDDIFRMVAVLKES